MNEHPSSVVRPPSSGHGIGQPVRRKEDLRLVTGSGRYGDDFVLPRMAHAAFVRSPHAHARIHAIAKEAALALGYISAEDFDKFVVPVNMTHP